MKYNKQTMNATIQWLFSVYWCLVDVMKQLVAWVKFFFNLIMKFAIERREMNTDFTRRFPTSSKRDWLLVVAKAPLSFW